MDMETESNLSEILNETGPQPDLNQAEPETVETPDSAEPETQESTEAAASEPEKVDTNAGEPTSPEVETKDADPPKTVPLESVLDERRKRQELERRLAQLEHKRTETPAPDPIEDPEAFVSFQDQKRQQERLQDRVAISEDIVRLHVGEDEYAKAEAAFSDELERNPSLAAEAMRSQNPAMFLYKTGKAALDRQEIGDPREYAAKQVQEALAKQQATFAETVAKQVEEQLAKFMPKSLADNASSEGRSSQTPVDDGIVPIEQLLK